MVPAQEQGQAAVPRGLPPSGCPERALTDPPGLQLGDWAPQRTQAQVVPRGPRGQGSTGRPRCPLASSWAQTRRVPRTQDFSRQRWCWRALWASL